MRGLARLSKVEEAKRRSTHLSRGQRREALEAIREVLERRGEVLLALACGGILVEGKPVRDIDVAVYTGYHVSPEEWPCYAGELRDLLEAAVRSRLGLRKAVDVVVLEYAPPGLRAAILAGGRLLANRRPGLRALLLLHSRDEEKSIQAKAARARRGS